ncbi:hypothetical protein CONLIGDRAFT_220349 [Coniochaeta ligniaria NRRL 30616]|uniref:F-box domain-containing protein n=1 Tax=Coniochaeta ligniaria NRRL 30616 TaxID=1408157 RepID=A0A1J7IN18_9PEZI|nr:hypothetical protein CONLIGDRAFT_220349 [Coniochaeta ligniaria NRRL 30616]
MASLPAKLMTEAESGLSQSPIRRLPPEIVDQIAESYLSHDDWKSIRLTSRFFDRSMIRLLFRRVFLSKTKLDRDVFLNISRSPHLATAARELTWYELAEDGDVFRDRDLSDYPDQSGNTFELPPFLTLARDAFWWPGSIGNHHPSDLLPWFQVALNNMPNIESFVSCRMPESRVVSKKQYLLTAQALYDGGSSPKRMNDGFYHFLLPTMRLPESSIKRLVLANEGIESSTFRIQPSDGPAFQKLTHIHLSIGRLRSSSDGGLSGVKVCLRSAFALEELRLCFRTENGIRGPKWRAAWQQTEHHSAVVAQLFDAGSEKEAMFWPHLRRLELEDIWLRQRHKIKIVLKLLEAHSSTLRHLAFRQCEIIGRMLSGMSNIPGLKLESLQITDHTDAVVLVLADSVLLGYVNNTGPPPDNVWRSSAICSASTWEAGLSVYDTRFKPKGMADYTDEDMAIIFECLHHSTEETPPSGSSVDEQVTVVETTMDNDTVTHTVAHGTESSSFMRSMAGSHPTKLWLFKHADGRQAISDEPLEFFSDWENSAPEDSDDSESDDAGGDSNSDDEGSDDELYVREEGNRKALDEDSDGVTSEDDGPSISVSVFYPNP